MTSGDRSSSQALTDKPFDVIVVGSGGAGLRSAIEARRAGADVLTMTKGMAFHSGATESANFSYCARFGYFGPGDTAARFADDVMASGLGLSRPELVRLIAERAGPEVEELAAMGMPWDKDSTGRYDLASFAGHTFPRAVHVDLRTGKAMMTVLGREIRHLGIAVWKYCFAVEVLVEEGAVAGMICLDIRTGETIGLAARSVILATGGAMEVYELHTNPTDLTGDGVALAYEAGAQLVDMEFFQSYPTVFVAPPGARGVHFPTGRLLDQGARLINARGEAFFGRHADGPVNRATRDTLSRAIAREVMEGGGTPRGGVFVDATHLPAESVRGKFVETYFNDLGIGPCADPQEVAPTPHYMMGGIRIDGNCHTTVSGLFAAGETTGGVHGANRLTGNGLPDIIVFGAHAGRSAARHAAQSKASPLPPSLVEKTARRREKSDAKRAVLRVGRVRRTVQRLMQRQASILKTGKSLRRALDGLDRIEREDLPKVSLVRPARSCNWKRVEALELDNIILAARLHCRTALVREETRGAHNRLDHPDLDDDRWRLRLLLAKGIDGIIAVTEERVEG